MTAGSGLFHSERMHNSRMFLCTLVVLGTGWLGTRPAAAADCASLPSPVFVTGSTAAKPILVQLARYLGSLPAPITIVYQGQGSCSGVDAILSATLLQGTAAFSTWDSSGTEVKCNVSADAPVVADIGVSDVFASTCFSLPGGLPTNVSDFLGPVQAMTFVTRKGSPELSISAEAAYNIYGFGNNSGVAPWDDETAIFRRDALSGTQQMIASAIGVPAAKWKGTATTGSGDLQNKLVGATPVEKTLGILAADVAQDNRALLNILAYQHTGQRCGYYPDRDANSNEKQNVRDGHYAIWGPMHFLTRIDGNGIVVKRAAAEIIGYLAGTKTAPAELDLVAFEAQHHVVSPCAMRVKRDRELGPMTPTSPPSACGCYYEKMANGSTSCTPCARTSDCPLQTSTCSYGYCEASW
jgi:ABC-type phosphate transport system substrate-binding protein